VIPKNISDIEYADIERLKKDKTPESDVLDYKERVVSDQDLVKHVCAFANTRGGDIIFGVKESGEGGHPTEISGLDASDLNKERLEQVILSNVVPRLDVQIKPICIPDSEKHVLLIRIPDSYQKPHQSNMSKKFYRRFQFESAEMTEGEVSDRYRSRFSDYRQVNEYVKGILAAAKEDTITVNIIVIPSNIEHRLIDTSDYDQATKLEEIRTILPNRRLEPFSHGLTSAYPGITSLDELQIHRNGCIQYVCHYNVKEDDVIVLTYGNMAEKLIGATQLACDIWSHYNYFGEGKIIAKLTCSSKSKLPDPRMNFGAPRTLDSLDATIEREHPVHYIETGHGRIASSIMNEVFNHYGVLRCPLFDEEGNYVGYRL